MGGYSKECGNAEKDWCVERETLKRVRRRKMNWFWNHMRRGCLLKAVLEGVEIAAWKRGREIGGFIYDWKNIRRQ